MQVQGLKLKRNMVLSYEVRLTSKCQKNIKKLSRVDLERCLAKIKVLESFSPKTTNVKKLQGIDSKVYRLRIGNIRVIFEVDSTTKIVWILEMGYRGGVYDDL